MATFPIGDDFIYNLVSTTSFNEASNGSQGELLPRFWPAQEQLNLQTLSSLTPLLNQTSQVSVRTWPAQGELSLQTLSSLTPLVNQTSQVSVRTYVATSTLSMNFSGSPTCNWPTLPTTGQIWPLNNYLYNYVTPTPPEPPNPIPALAPVLWYDFADEATVTTSGTEITAVASKGSRNWTLTKSTTGPQYVTGINGKKCLDWGVSPSHPNFMYNSDTTSTTIGEVYVVVDASFGGNMGNYAGLFTSYTNAWYVLGFASALTESGTGFDQLFINNGASNRFPGDVFASPSIDNPAIMRINNSTNTSFNTTGGFEIGNDRGNSSLNRGWCGLIGEYVVFPSPLSSIDRAAVQNHLAAKWGITLV